MPVITVKHPPIAQPRQRHAIRYGKGSYVCKCCGYRTNPFISNYTPAKHDVNKFKDAIRIAWIGTREDKFDGPVSLNAEVQFARPKSHYRVGRFSHLLKAGINNHWHTQKPDIDNVIKAIKDALTSHAYHDDSQVCVESISKRWGPRDLVVITIEPLPDEAIEAA